MIAVTLLNNPMQLVKKLKNRNRKHDQKNININRRIEAIKDLQVMGFTRDEIAEQLKLD